MAKRSSRTQIVRIPSASRAPAPVIRISAPRAVAPRKPKRRHHRSSSSGSGNVSHITRFAIGGAAVGFIEKQNLLSFLPTVPMLGKKGTIAVLAYFWRKNGGPALAGDVALAAAVLSGYQLAKDGRIDGDDE